MKTNKHPTLKRYLLAIIAMVMTVAGAIALAADISNLSTQSCGPTTGEWHFVNNKIPRGTAPGTLTATWSSGDMCVVSASTVNKKNQHFDCIAAGTLLSASTNLPGKLVLSHHSCGEPPKCEPEKEGEVCDGRDNDCDGQIDEGDVCKIDPPK